VSFMGQDDGNLGVRNSQALADSAATDALRRSPETAHRVASRWPDDLLRKGLIVVGVLVLLAWGLTLLNH